MNLNDASRIIDIIDGRIEEKSRSMSKVETTWAEVASVATDHRSIEAFMYGETDSDYASPGFRLPDGLVVSAGDLVKVAMDKFRGDRWVLETRQATPSAYNQIEWNPTSGYLSYGPGTAAPSAHVYFSSDYGVVHSDAGLTTPYFDSQTWNFVGETHLYRSTGAQYVLLTDPTVFNSSQVAFAMKNTGEMQWGPSGAARDVTFYRAGTEEMMLTSMLTIENAGNPINRAIQARGYVDSFRDGNVSRSTFRFFKATTDTQPSVQMYIGSSNERGIQIGRGGTNAVDTSLYHDGTTVGKLYLNGTSGADLEIVNGDLTVPAGLVWASGDIRSGAAATAGDTSTGVMVRSAGAIELFGGTPYIDFKNNNQDYDARLILLSDTVLQLVAANLDVSGGYVDASTGFVTSGYVRADGDITNAAGTELRAPFRMQAGTASLTFSNVAVSNTSVTFDTSRFTQTPRIFITQTSLQAGSGTLIPKLTGASSTGFSLYAYTGNGANTTVSGSVTFDWVAIQMASGSGSG